MSDGIYVRVTYRDEICFEKKFRVISGDTIVLSVDDLVAEKVAAEREWQTLTENEIKHLWYEACQTNLELTSQLIVHLARNIEAKLKEKNS